MNDLQSLVQQAQAGNLAAFGTLVERYQDMAVGYATAILRDRHLAEDAAQEAFMEAHRCLATLHEPGAFGSWLRRIVFKQCDRLTRGKRHVTVPLEAALERSSDALSPADALEKAEARHQVRHAIHALPDEQRVITTLFYISEYSQKEVAAFLELSPVKVNNALRSARKRLRERMIEMTQETLYEQRPSKDTKFSTQVLTMIQAAQAGDAATVGKLLDENPKLRDAKGKMTYGGPDKVQPIHAAVAAGHHAIVQQLLASGANVDGVDDRGRTPLHIAAAQRQAKIAQLLLEHDATMDVFTAARLGDVDQLSTLLQADNSLANAKGPDGAMPLHYVVNVETARILVAHGADVNAVDNQDVPPIVWHGADEEITKFLVASGAEVADLFMAAAIGNPDIVQRLIEQDPTSVNQTKLVHGNQLPPLAAAVFNQQPAIVELLLTHGADPNVALFDGAVTLLHEAVKGGNVDVVRLLLTHGVDPNVKDGVRGEAPIAWVNEENTAIRELLQEVAAQ